MFHNSSIRSLSSKLLIPEENEMKIFRMCRCSGLFLLLALVFSAVVSSSTPSTATASGYKMTYTQATNYLWNAGITWSSSGNCSNRYNSRCTAFDQINSGTIAGIIGFKRASGCAVNITGGTEAGHSGGTYSHWNGYKVDITPTACVSNYIVRNFTYLGRRQGDLAPMYRSPAGNIYARESNHWDILYY